MMNDACTAHDARDFSALSEVASLIGDRFSTPRSSSLLSSAPPFSAVLRSFATL